MIDTSAIDNQIAEAQANKELRQAAGLTDEEREAKRAARKAKKEADGTIAQAKREARAAKRAALLASKKPAHVFKLEKATSKLPALDESMTAALEDLKHDFTVPELAILALHLQHAVRVDSTLKAIAVRNDEQPVLAEGDSVKIVSGDPRYIGKEGTVIKTKKIHVFVDVGGKKPLYAFTSDVEKI